MVPSGEREGEEQCRARGPRGQTATHKTSCRDMSHNREMLLFSRYVSSSLRPHGLQPAWLLCPWNSPAKNTGVFCHSLLQGIFLDQGSNSHLLQWKWILYH